MNREWINEETQAKINEILNFIPIEIMEHALDLLEQIVYFNPTNQRRRIISLMWKLCTTKTIAGGCFRSNTYNLQHELCWYLDGWIWQVEYGENGNPDLNELMLKSLNK